MSDPMTRRTFVGTATFVAGAALVPATLPGLLGAGALPDAHSRRDGLSQLTDAPAPPDARRGPVIGFHMDRPYLDPTGMAEPYVPPVGTRSGQVLAQLSEREFRSLHPYG